MKRDFADAKTNSTPGARLRECRKSKNMTQEDLAKAVSFTTNYISMLETGVRSLDWNNADRFSKALGVSPDYLMCESDLINGKWYAPMDLETFGVIDAHFLYFLIAAGHDIIFHVVPLFDGKAPNIKEWHGKEYKEWDSLEIKTPINKIKDLCLSDPHCKLIMSEKQSEAIIRRVSIDGITISFGRFVFIVNRIYDYIDFTLKTIKPVFDDYVHNIDVGDMLIQEQIERSRMEKGGIAPTLQETLDSIAGKGNYTIIPMDEKQPGK